MNIHQLSVAYLQEQDRILLRIKTLANEELRLWLTRRLSLGLLPLLRQLITEQVAQLETARYGLISSPPGEQAPQTKQMLAEFKREELLQKTDFKTPYQEEAATLLFGNEPLLITEVNVTPKPEGRLEIEFHEKMSGDTQTRGFQAVLEQDLVHGLLHLLEQATQTSQWLQTTSPALATSAPTALEDGVPSDAKPKYLN